MGKRIQRVEIDKMNTKLLELGYVGENEHTEVQIDCSGVLWDYPEATAEMTVQAPNGEKYPVVPELKDNVVVWDVTDSDLVYAGSGKIQITLKNGTEVIKSASCGTRIMESITATGPAPTPLENWMNQAEETAHQIALTAKDEVIEQIQDAAEEARESIPADYTQLSDDVTGLKSAITNIEDNLDTIAKTEVMVTDYQVELINPSPDTVLKTNNIKGATSLALCVSTGNAIRLPYFRQSGFSQNGLTFTINSDGSITVNGTATADTTYNIAYYTTNIVQFSYVRAEDNVRLYGWYLSGCVDGSDSTYYITNVNTGHRCKTGAVDAFGGSPQTVVNLALIIKSGVTLADKIFYPMLAQSADAEFSSPIAQTDQYSATVASTDEEYVWENINLKSGKNLIITDKGNTLTATVPGYETFANIHEEIDGIKQIVGDNWWGGKKWVAFGTSITDNYSDNSYITQGEHTGEHTGKYVPYLLELSGLSETDFVNRGISGGRIDGHILYYLRYYTADMANADLITIEGAVNDFASSVPLGVVGDTVPYTSSLLPDSTAQGTFAGACYQAFTTALTNAPNAVVVLLTEPTGKNHVGYANYNQLRKNDLGLYQDDYIKMTMDVAEFVGIPVINCGRDSMINAQNPQFIADHIHHTYLGGYQYAKTIWAKLKDIPNKALSVPD